MHSPISAAIDENGDMYVTEMIDYPFYPKPGELPLGHCAGLLRDTDGDGRYDKSYASSPIISCGRAASRVERGARSSPLLPTSGT